MKQTTTLTGADLYDAHLELHGMYENQKLIVPGLLQSKVSQAVRMQLADLIQKAAKFYMDFEKFRLEFIDLHGIPNAQGVKTVSETIPGDTIDEATGEVSQIPNPRHKELMDTVEAMLTSENEIRKPKLKPEDFSEVPGDLSLNVITSLVTF